MLAVPGMLTALLVAVARFDLELSVSPLVVPAGLLVALLCLIATFVSPRYLFHSTPASFLLCRLSAQSLPELLSSLSLPTVLAASHCSSSGRARVASSDVVI
jgi:hypothetical protein